VRKHRLFSKRSPDARIILIQTEKPPHKPAARALNNEPSAFLTHAKRLVARHDNMPFAVLRIPEELS
jgi:hypothetical protein